MHYLYMFYFIYIYLFIYICHVPHGPGPSGKVKDEWEGVIEPIPIIFTAISISTNIGLIKYYAVRGLRFIASAYI